MKIQIQGGALASQSGRARARALGVGWIPRDDFAGIHDVVRIQGALDATLNVDVRDAVLLDDVLLFTYADAVFAGRGASHLDGVADDFVLERDERGAFALLKRNQTVEITVGYVRAYDAWEASLFELVLGDADALGEF